MNTNHYPSVWLCVQLTKIWFPKTEKSYSTEDNINFIIWESGSIVCPNIMEMLDVMPDFPKRDNLEWFIDIDFKNGISSITITYSHESWPITFSDTPIYYWTLTDWIASMILWLHENNYLNFNK